MNASTSEDTNIRYLWMRNDEVHRIAELDRSEHVTINYVVQDGALEKVEVDWHVPPWSVQGEEEHSVAHMIEFCQDHLHNGARMLGAFDGEKLVGIGILRPELSHHMAQLDFLHVSRAYRRRGIASRITRELCKLAVDDGAEKVYVSATPSESAVDFYLSQDFHLTMDVRPELFALEPEDIRMVKELISER
ncbi:MAG: GNAT family N-acetyltransferase [Anaerolineales bacterium]|nr:GNAT family N-acetyltransferase [Anaerolineales bacterium]